MRTAKLPKASLSRWFVALALGAAAALALIAGMEVEAAQPPTKIAFKLDPRVTFGLYLGDRWVTPTTFTQVQQFGTDLNVIARSHDSVSWSSNNSSVTVSPSVGSQVSINVKRAGQATVTAGGAVLNVSATQADTGVLVVQIRQ